MLKGVTKPKLTDMAQNEPPKKLRGKALPPAMSIPDQMEHKTSFLDKLDTTLTSIIEKEGGVKDYQELTEVCVTLKSDFLAIVREATSGQKRVVMKCLTDNYGKLFCSVPCLKVKFVS